MDPRTSPTVAFDATKTMTKLNPPEQHGSTAAGVDDDEVASGGDRHSTTTTMTMTVVGLANVNDDKATAKSRSQASGLFCVIVRALYRTAAIDSVDFANCYDAVAHPIASIALQSFKVQKVMVAMMLSVLQTMRWYLKSAFRQSPTYFGGNADDPLMGFGQGTGASPQGSWQCAPYS
jgi:hypothetical protein